MTLSQLHRLRPGLPLTNDCNKNPQKFQAFVSAHFSSSWNFWPCKPVRNAAARSTTGKSVKVGCPTPPRARRIEPPTKCRASETVSLIAEYPGVGWGLVHFSAGKRVLRKNVGRKHGPVPFRIAAPASGASPRQPPDQQPDGHDRQRRHDQRHPRMTKGNQSLPGRRRKVGGRERLRIGDVDRFGGLLGEMLAIVVDLYGQTHSQEIRIGVSLGAVGRMPGDNRRGVRRTTAAFAAATLAGGGTGGPTGSPTLAPPTPASACRPTGPDSA